MYRMKGIKSTKKKKPEKNDQPNGRNEDARIIFTRRRCDIIPKDFHEQDSVLASGPGLRRSWPGLGFAISRRQMWPGFLLG